jgi:hypothetical protein
MSENDRVGPLQQSVVRSETDGSEVVSAVGCAPVLVAPSPSNGDVETPLFDGSERRKQQGL